MLLKILFYLFITTGTINLVHFGLYLIGGNLYDIQAHKRVHKIKISKKRRLTNPLVSVLIPAFNEAKVIERCLDSIRNNSYKKVELIVNNDASTDDTAAIVKDYIKRYPKLSLRLVNRRRNAGKASGLNYIGRRWARGQLIMTLDADSLLHKEAIKNTVEYFDDPLVVGVAANVRIIEVPTILGLLQRFEHMMSYRSKKFYTLINCELIIGGVASTYRSDLMRSVRFYDTDTVTEDIGLSMKIAALGNKLNRLVYASDVAAMTEPVASFKALVRQRYRWKLGNLQNLFKYRRMAFGGKRYSKSLSWYRMPMAYLGEIMLISEPIALGYIVYLSIHYLSLALFFSAYMAITVYILLVIWPDEHLSLLGKLRSSAYAPFMYFMFYIMNLVQLISALRCIANANQIVNLVKHENPWISPVRQGQKAVKFS